MHNRKQFLFKCLPHLTERAMKELLPQELSKMEFKTADEIVDYLRNSDATTNDANFILKIREVLISLQVSEITTEEVLWGVMRDHDNIVSDDSGMTLFLWACHLGSTVWFEKLVGEADLSAVDKAGYGVAFHAVMGGNLSIVQELHNKGINFNTASPSKRPLILEAAGGTNPELLSWMLKNENDAAVIRQCLKSFVSFNDDYETTRLLCSQPDVDYAISADESSLTPLEIALVKEHFLSAKALLDSNVCPAPFEKTDENIINALSNDSSVAATNYAKLLVKEEVKLGRERVFALIGKSKETSAIKQIFYLADINPALDIDISLFDGDTQALIYQSMF